MTLEEAGRKERYAFFAEVMQRENCTKVATAHNSNDNAETVLMNIIRGSGTSGLKGIMPCASWQFYQEEGKEESPLLMNVIRPLIDCTRQEIERYCEEKKLEPRHDESNDEMIYTRNKIRLGLIPYMEKNFNESIVSHLNQLSSIVREEETYWEKQVESAYQKCLVVETTGKVVCNLKIFNTLDTVIQKRLIVKCIIKAVGNAKDIEKVHIEDILKLCQKNVGGKYLTPRKHIKIAVNRGKVEFTKM